MATQYPITDETLRHRYALSGLEQLGLSFDAAMQTACIRTSLICGARAAARASQINRAHPHWTERSTE